MAKSEVDEEIIAVPKVKKTPKKKKSAGKKSRRQGIDWRALYLYAVCLITMLVCLFSVVSFIRNGVSFIYPDPGYVDPSVPAGAAATFAKSAQLSQSHHQSIMGMVDGVTTFIVAAPLYYYHWNLTRKED